MKQKKKPKHKHRGYGQQIHDLKSPVQSAAISESLALFLLVLKDKMDIGIDDMRRIWEKVNAFANDIGNGRALIDDCLADLQSKAGIYIDPVSLILNPNPTGLCYADVITARQKTKRRTVNLTEAMILWVLMEQEGWVPATLKELKAEMDYQADSIAKGYIKVEDLLGVLQEEYGITIKETPE